MPRTHLPHGVLAEQHAHYCRAELALLKRSAPSERHAGRDSPEKSSRSRSDASAASPDAAEDEEGQRDDDQDDEDGPQHGELRSLDGVALR